ncbi:MAG TPA: amidohydrolase family protein [candidate division Zixibacteria bacterium]|nr:amidohydrolase family protein [candidate division Zixibacteria bacterium]
MRALLSILLLSLLTASFTTAHDYVPGSAQATPILLKGGDLYTVSNGIKPATDLLFENGRITAIGIDLTPPEKATIIDVTGKNVYPGLIAPYTTIGLIEIGEVRATNDLQEEGQINPDVQSHVAYNPDSEIIPSVRSNGITTALIVPRGSLLCGRSFLVNLDGWTVEDAGERFDVGLHLNWPQVAVSKDWWDPRPLEEQKKAMTEQRQSLYESFDNARAYYLAKHADSTIPRDSRWEAMMPIFDRTVPVFVQAGDYRQIEQAVAFASEYGFRMILVGGADAWMLSELLVEHDIPVIVQRPQALPMREDDSYDAIYGLAGQLASAGVKIAISTAGSDGGTATGVRNLPLQAGQAVAFGLNKETALRAITLTPAELFGVDSDLGSLEINKKATIVVSEGDIMDELGNRVVLEFIEGRQVDLDNKHKELYRKYRQKHFE